MRFLKAILIVLGIMILGLLIFCWWSFYYPKPVESSIVHHRGQSARILQPGQSLRVMNWNVAAFVGNQDNNFFEPGVKNEYPLASRYRQIITGVAQVIQEYDPDIINLQDVDVDSKRSAYLNQIQILMNHLPDDYRYFACVTQAKAKFLPVSWVKYGSIHSQICTISKYKIQNIKRYMLHGLENVPFYWILPYVRTTSVSEIPVMGKNALVVQNTYWSSWDYSVSEKMKQSSNTLKIFQSYQKAGQPVLLAGDFNSLAHKKLINDVVINDKHIYQPYQISPLKKYFDLYASAPSYQQVLGPSRKKYLTYMPSQLTDKEADRTLDFIFISPTLRFEKSSVIQTEETKKLSDHYPVLATIRLPNAHAH
ncbi:endonuclease/exonuclease/phosphatase family protein [Gammaproteobacteria bacterium]|nr:endonuclease/exonuclease/phosphatase family protein [Gammaproteobacteria bacterium]